MPSPSRRTSPRFRAASCFSAKPTPPSHVSTEGTPRVVSMRSSTSKVGKLAFATLRMILRVARLGTWPVMRMRLPRRPAVHTYFSVVGARSMRFSTVLRPQTSERRLAAFSGSVSSPERPCRVASRPSKRTSVQPMPPSVRARAARARKSPSMRPCSACTATQLSTSRGMMPQSQRHQLHFMRPRLPSWSLGRPPAHVCGRRCCARANRRQTPGRLIRCRGLPWALLRRHYRQPAPAFQAGAQSPRVGR